MNLNTLIVLLTGIFAAADKPPTAKQEMKNLQGTWTATKAVVSGKEVPLKRMGMDRFVVDGDKMSVMLGKKTVDSFQFKVDPKQTPRAMDWIHKKKGRLPLIYSLEKDILRICFELPSREPRKLNRPKSFETKGQRAAVVTAKFIKKPKNKR